MSTIKNPDKEYYLIARCKAHGIFVDVFRHVDVETRYIFEKDGKEIKIVLFEDNSKYFRGKKVDFFNKMEKAVVDKFGELPPYSENQEWDGHKTFSALGLRKNRRKS